MANRFIQKFDLSKYSLKNFLSAGEICIDTNASNALKYNKGGTVVSLLDSSGQVPSVPVSVTATRNITAAGTYVLNGAAGGTLTLPAATGTGATYRFVVGVVAATNPWKVQVANSTDFFGGQCFAVSNTDGTGKAWQTADTGTVATESDTITFLVNGSTGGKVGDTIEIKDVKTAVFAVQIFAKQVTTEATPFSVAV